MVIKIKGLTRPPLSEMKSSPQKDNDVHYPNEELEDLKNESIKKDSAEIESDSSPEKGEGKAARRDKRKSSNDESDSVYPPSETIKKSTNEENQHWIVLIIFAVISLLVGAITIWFKSTPIPSKAITVAEIVNELKMKFPHQPDRTYRIIKSAIQMAENDNNPSPGIIILLASKEAKETNKQFANNLSRLVSPNSEFIHIPSSSPKSPCDFKEEIDVSLQRNLSPDVMQGVLVENIDKMPFEAARIFHGFCDHENALFQKAVYVMTLNSHEKIASDSRPKQWDALAVQQLKSGWKDQDDDLVSPLISRLTGNVAAILGTP